MSRRSLFVVSLILTVLLTPPAWHPEPVRIQLARWFGPGTYVSPPPSLPSAAFEPETFCPADLAGWRSSQTIGDVTIRASRSCEPDNPFAVAAFVRGTNNVAEGVLQQSGLTPDAVTKGEDLDGDGDPDVIHLRLEVAELNGASPDNTEPVVQFPIAPGVKPGFWVFAPKMAGMATENFESLRARPMLRLPSPVIRVEQGDRIEITLENSHYMPHTIHFHGVDHPFVDESGEGNDGVPIASEMPVMPGRDRTYNLTPRQAGTMFYHCHVQPHLHIMMGLQGMFVVEENAPDNWVQTLNVGGGQVRAPSKGVQEEYDREYDLHYFDIDTELNEIIQSSNDPRVITDEMHNRYDITDATFDLFTVNGRSFPYTFRESLVSVEPDERVRLRVLNGGSGPLALHTHGHKPTITAFDGVPVPTPARITRDVFMLSSAQRVDLTLDTTNDGLHSFGSGIWLMHDHQQKGTTTDGIGPGGNISAIVYGDYQGEDGWPLTQGMPYDLFFTEAYYKGLLPLWEAYAGDSFSPPAPASRFHLRTLAFALAVGATLGFGLLLLRGRT